MSDIRCTICSQVSGDGSVCSVCGYDTSAVFLGVDAAKQARSRAEDRWEAHKSKTETEAALKAICNNDDEQTATSLNAEFKDTYKSIPSNNVLVPDFRNQRLGVILGGLDPVKNYHLTINIKRDGRPTEYFVQGKQHIHIGHISLLGSQISFGARDMDDKANPPSVLYWVNSTNIKPPLINEDLAIALVHNDANFLAMLGMAGHRSEVVLYAAYLRNPQLIGYFVPRGMKYSREEFEKIGFLHARKLQKRIDKALENIADIGLSLEQAFI